MPALTPTQLAQLGLPPKPPMADAAIVDPKTGKPTTVYTNWLARYDEWLRKFIALLGE